jgi:hypothetical protein
MQALEGCMRSQPCVGRKRKRDSGDIKTEEHVEFAVNKKP